MLHSIAPLPTQRAQARFHLPLLAGALAVLLLKPFVHDLTAFGAVGSALSAGYKFAFLIAIVLAPYAGWRVFFHGATALAMSTAGTTRALVEVASALLFPCVMSLWFLPEQGIEDWAFIDTMFSSPWSLAPLALIAYAAWFGSRQAGTELPFRSFAIAATVVFALYFYGHAGMSAEGSAYDDEGVRVSIDKEALEAAAVSGRHFVQYWIGVFVAYATMLISLRRQSRA